MLLDDLSKCADEKDLEAASLVLTQLENKLGESDAEVIRARTLLDFLGEEE